MVTGYFGGSISIYMPLLTHLCALLTGVHGITVTGVVTISQKWPLVIFHTSMKWHY